MPGGAFIVRNLPGSVGVFPEAVVRGEVFPGKDVAIGELAFVGCPGSHLDLEGGIIAVKPEEVVHRGLGVSLEFPSSTHLDMIHEVERPEVIVDIDKLVVRAPEVGDLLIELPVHFGGLG